MMNNLLRMAIQPSMIWFQPWSSFSLTSKLPLHFLAAAELNFLRINRSISVPCCFANDHPLPGIFPLNNPARLGNSPISLCLLRPKWPVSGRLPRDPLRRGRTVVHVKGCFGAIWSTRPW